MKALVIIDMQNDFITGSLANKRAQKIVPNIVKLIEGGGYDAAFVTKDTHSSNYMDTPEGKKLPVKHCMYGTAGWCVEGKILTALEENFVGRANWCSDKRGTDGFVRFSIKPADESVPFVVYIEKRTFGTMAWRNMEGWLRDADIDVVGVCTDICVVSNVLILKAIYPDASISVLSDLCAGTTDEAHEAALKTMASCQVDIKESGLPQEGDGWPAKPGVMW